MQTKSAIVFDDEHLLLNVRGHYLQFVFNMLF